MIFSSFDQFVNTVRLFITHTSQSLKKIVFVAKVHFSSNRRAPGWGLDHMKGNFKRVQAPWVCGPAVRYLL